MYTYIYTYIYTNVYIDIHIPASCDISVMSFLSMAASSARAFAAFDAATLPMAIMLLNRDT